MTPPRLGFHLAAITALTIVYYITGKLGLRLASVHPSATAVWLPTGITLAALLVFGTRAWPGAFVGAFLVNVTTHGSVATSIGIAVGNTLEGLAGASLMNRLAGGRRAFDRAQDVFKFAVLAGLVSTTISATIGVGSLALGGYAEGADVGSIWLTWWLGDAASALIVAPMLLLWVAHPRVAWGRNRSVEALLLLLGLIGVGIAVFGEAIHITAQDSPLAFLTVPVLVWTAFRFSQRETATAIFLLAAMAVWGTLNRLGPFALDSLNESLLLVYVFMGVIAIMALALAAGVSERQRAEETIQEGETRLRLLLQELPALLWLTDAALRITFVQGAGLATLKLAPHEMVGTTVTDHFPDESEDSPVFAHRRALRGEPCSYEVAFRDRVFQAYVEPMRGRERAIVGCVGMALDITERKQAEDALRLAHDELEKKVQERTEALTKANAALWNEIAERTRVEDSLKRNQMQLSEAQQLAHVGSWDWDIAANTITWSDELYRIYGLKPREISITYGTFVGCLHPDDNLFVQGIVEQALKDHQPFSAYHRIVRPDGAVRLVHARGTVVADRAGNPIRMYGMTQDMTDLKRAEAALRESEERFRSFMNNSPAVAWMKDERGRHVYLNEPFERRFNRTLEAVRNKTDFDLWPQDIARELRANDQLVLSSGKPLETVETVPTPDGQTRFWLVYKFPFQDASGNRFVGGMAADITERKRAEEALRESEERFRNAFAQAAVGLAMTDRHGRFLHVNKRYCAMTGYAEHELYRMEFLAITHPDDRARSMEFVRQLLAGEINSFVIQKRYVRKSGDLVWVQNSISAVRDDRGSPVNMIAIAEDITERKQAEDALQKSEERYRSAIAALEEGVFLQDADGVIRACNSSAERILGLSADQIMGLTSYDPRWRAIHEDGSPFPGEAHPTTITLRTGKPCRNVVMGVHKPDGTLTWISVNTQPLAREQRARPYAVVASFFDITERKRAEVIRQHLLGKVMSVQEEERRRIARELHDETGQSLTSLLVGLRSLEEMPSAEAMRARVAELREIAAQALSEVKRLALGLRPSVLDDLGLEAALRRSAGEFTQAHGIPVDMYANGLDDHRLPAPVESALYRIVQEALTNVAKHAAATWVSVLLRSTPSDVRVIIEDNGCGFDADSVVQSGPAGERLGLHGMRERAMLLNGSIKVESAPGRGTAIYVRIPIEEGRQEEPV